MADLTLYHAAPSRSSIALWMLEEIGEPYDIKLIKLSEGENLKPGYLAINPMGKVPALRHGDTVITELHVSYYRHDGQVVVLPAATVTELSPDGSKVGIERGGNMYVYNFATAKETQLTNDQTDEHGTFNGHYDWVYEEEFDCRDGFRGSPDLALHRRQMAD